MRYTSPEVKFARRLKIKSREKNFHIKKARVDYHKYSNDLYTYLKNQKIKFHIQKRLRKNIIKKNKVKRMIRV